MSYLVTETSVSHNGNNSSSQFYPIPFDYDVTGGAHPIHALLNGVEFTDFEVSELGARTFAPVASADILLFYRDTPRVQPRTFPDEELPRPQEIEESLNRLARHDQEQSEALSRAPLLPIGANPADFANTTIGRGENGEPVSRTKEQEIDFLQLNPQQIAKSILGLLSLEASLVVDLPVEDGAFEVSYEASEITEIDSAIMIFDDGMQPVSVTGINTTDKKICFSASVEGDGYLVRIKGR